MSDIFVQRFEHLEDKPKADQALTTLKRIASLVKPIMRKHGWNLPVLAEFYPDTPNLLGLNMNGGEKILVRLREPFDHAAFLQEESVVQTMLHELTHNVHGPHDEKFYKFLSELQDEYDALQRSGYAGEGFFSPGQRLGTNVSRDVPPHIARLKALEAAEKRRATSQVLGRGGRLGGGPSTRGLTPREMAAKAAEQRARDETSCGSVIVAQRQAQRAASTTNATISTGPKNPPPTVNSRQSIPGPSTMRAGNRPPSRLVTKPTPLGIRPNRPTPHRNTEASNWSCGACTLLNGPLTTQCGACLTKRPVVLPVWTCHTCLEPDIPSEYMFCSFCGVARHSPQQQQQQQPILIH